jgi:O-antigen/teichoic acid export membrane protein
VLSLLALLSAVAPVLAEPLTHAQRLWLYVTLAASPILTEELGALLGGVAVSQGQLRLVLAIVAVTLGGWLATTALYVFGWWKGRWVRGRFPKAGAAMKRWLRALRPVRGRRDRRTGRRRLADHPSAAPCAGGRGGRRPGRAGLRRIRPGV